MRKKKANQNKKYYSINHRIRVPEVRVAGSEGENLGVMSTRDALKRAHEEGLDLVVISEKANPPVAKILDFNKFLYVENKKASASKQKSKKSELKELRFGPGIAEGDIKMRIDKARGYIEDNNRVTVSVVLKGREKAFPEVAFEKIERFTKDLEDVAKQEKNPKRMGNAIKVTYVRK